MKRSDYLAIGTAALFSLSMLFDPMKTLTAEHSFMMSFVKFAFLATLGECIALRITTGTYSRKGFGILPKALIWGVLGIAIKCAFTIFATGAPILLAHIAPELAKESTLLKAFAISVSMNMIFAPVLMVTHKLTDAHVHNTGGTLRGLLRKPDIARLFQSIDWNIMWNFVFKKTIPLFWIPAHTITFILPPELRILFAALLGIALGVILAFASLKDATPK